MRYVSREVLESSLNATLDNRETPVFGLQTGDVIEQINGNSVASPDEVRRMLLETVTWGEPVNLKVRRGYPQPFVTHPRLDLFVGSTSPHKLQTMGCTVCHDGQGSATSFKWASHYPNTIKERTQWRKEHGWFENHHWIYPMFPERFSEASCLKCHHEVVELEPSERFPDPPAPNADGRLRRGANLWLLRLPRSRRLRRPGEAHRSRHAARAELFCGRSAGRLPVELARRGADAAATRVDASRRPAQAELDAITANLSSLSLAKQLGDTVGAETWNETARHRLKQIIDEDAQRLADYEARQGRRRKG